MREHICRHERLVALKKVRKKFPVLWLQVNFNLHSSSPSGQVLAQGTQKIPRAMAASEFQFAQLKSQCASAGTYSWRPGTGSHCQSSPRI